MFEQNGCSSLILMTGPQLDSPLQQERESGKIQEEKRWTIILVSLSNENLRPCAIIHV